MENHYISNPAVDLGTIDYQEALDLQRKLVERVRKWDSGDILLILDHPPVFTVGRGKIESNFAGVEVVETERGGDVTYHGPGQLVIYPIIDLEKNKISGVRKYVGMIESIVIDSLRDNGYDASVGNEPGIWVNGLKVASIGMAIKNNISYHGISINISREVLKGFQKIRACGLEPSMIWFVDINRHKLVMDLLQNFSSRLHEFNMVPKDFFYSII